MTDSVDTSRRHFLQLSALFTAAGAAPLLGALNTAQAKEPEAPVRVGYLPITDATPLLVAHQQKLWEKQGLEVEKPRLFRSWAQLVEAFLSGQVNVVHMLAPMSVYARYGSQSPAKVVAWNHVDGSSIAIAAKQNINEIKDLGGTTIAIPFWYSIHNIVLQYLLRKEGLEPIGRGEPSAQQVKLVVMPPSDMLPALATNRIAGYIVAEPFVALSELKGLGKVLRFTGDVWKEHACCVVMMHQKDLELRPDWTQKVVNGIVQAQAWARENRAATAQLLSRREPARYTPHTVEALTKVLAPEAKDWRNYREGGAIKHDEWSRHRIDFQPYPFPSYTEKMVELLQSTYVEGESDFLEKLTPAAVAKDLVDDSFVKKAIETQGGMTVFGQPNSYVREEVVDA
ncbi:MAG TPA: ABC transporter substrate-binding protein [Alcanivoracaceae bacterium]|nr:ABC transporter substrate-binding protein [Alcanivoracaceae bacterium]